MFLSPRSFSTSSEASTITITADGGQPASRVTRLIPAAYFAILPFSTAVTTTKNQPAALAANQYFPQQHTIATNWGQPIVLTNSRNLISSHQPGLDGREFHGHCGEFRVSPLSWESSMDKRGF